MYTRHNEVPVYEYRESQVNALYYNHVHVALNRIGKSIRLDLPGLRSLDFILQRDAWIIVDRALNDFPVVAWTQFETGHRSSLHEPVNCQLKLFHRHAEIILDQAIEAMEMMLGEELDTDNLDDKAGVINFKP